MRSENLSFLDITILQCIYRTDRIAISNLSSITTKVSEREISNPVENLIERRYVSLNQDGSMYFKLGELYSIEKIKKEIERRTSDNSHEL